MKHKVCMVLVDFKWTESSKGELLAVELTFIQRNQGEGKIWQKLITSY